MRSGPRRWSLAVVLLGCALNAAWPHAQPVAIAPALDRARLLADAAALADPAFEGRLTGSAGGLKARAFIESAFAQIGLVPAGAEGYREPFAFSLRRFRALPLPGPPFRRAFRDAANLVGRIEGTEPHRAAIVISAHYDHLGIRDGVVYPGADDNASGVAALLAVARAMKARPPRHPMLFAAFDAEEQRLRGARTFVRLRRQQPFALNVNLDMVSRSARREIYAAGTSHTPALRPILEGLRAPTGVTLRFGHDTPDLGPDDWTMLSDHGAFHEAGVPFVYFGVEDHEDYHQPTDTFDRIDAQFFGDVTTLIVDAVIALDRALP